MAPYPVVTPIKQSVVKVLKTISLKITVIWTSGVGGGGGGSQLLSGRGHPLLGPNALFLLS